MISFLRRKLGPWPPALIITICCNNWLLALWLNPALPTSTSLISEISAKTQPFHGVFQTGDIIAGMLVLAATPLVWQLVRGHELRWHALLTATVALAGLDSIIDALLPIACAPSIDVHCQLLGPHNVVTIAHLAESNIAGVLLFVTPLLWWWFSRQKHTLLARLSIALVALELFVGLSIVITRSFGVHWEGVLQRIYELGIGGWLGCVVALSMQHYMGGTARMRPDQTASSRLTRTARR